jgi:hypothetical protein
MKYKVYIRNADQGFNVDVLIIEAKSKASAYAKAKKAARALHTSGDYMIYAQSLGKRKNPCGSKRK